MLHLVEERREGGLKVVVDSIQREALPLPGKVVMMGDHGQRGFGDYLGHRQAERNVHWDSQDVLGQKDFDLELLDEAVNLVLEALFEGLDLVGDGAGSERHAEELALNVGNLRMPKERQRRDVTCLRWGVKQPGHPKARVAHAGQNLGPFSRFERNAVSTVEACGDEADALGRACSEYAEGHQ